MFRNGRLFGDFDKNILICYREPEGRKGPCLSLKPAKGNEYLIIASPSVACCQDCSLHFAEGCGPLAGFSEWQAFNMQ